VAKYKTYNAKQWRDVCDSSNFKAPNFFDPEGEREREREENERRRIARKIKREREASEQPAAHMDVEQENDGSPPVAPSASEAAAVFDSPFAAAPAAAPSPAPSSVDGASPTKEKPKPRKLTALERAIPSEEEWATFDWNTLDYGERATDW
jgi:hypothetical protein